MGFSWSKVYVRPSNDFNGNPGEGPQSVIVGEKDGAAGFDGYRQMNGIGRVKSKLCTDRGRPVDHSARKRHALPDGSGKVVFIIRQQFRVPTPQSLDAPLHPSQVTDDAHDIL